MVLRAIPARLAHRRDPAASASAALPSPEDAKRVIGAVKT
jgi:hypothetical protein